MNSLLKRQLKRAKLDSENLSPEYEMLLSLVSSAYQDFEDDKDLLERSLLISSDELSEANASMRATLNAFPDLVLTVDESGLITSVKSNKLITLLERLGYESPSEINQKDLTEIIGTNNRPKLSKRIRNLVQTGEMQSFEFSTDRGSKAGFYEARLLCTSDKKILVCIRDISERRQAEQERKDALIQLESVKKSVALGRLASGIAHDFNNLLFSIMGYATLVSRSKVADAAIENYAEQIMIATKRGKELVEQLLIFNRWEQQSAQAVKLSDFLTEVKGLLKSFEKDNVKLNVIDKTNGESFVSGNPGKLHRALTNLAKNALQEVSVNGGTVTLTLEELGLEEEFSNRWGNKLNPGSYIKICVKDDGRGISETAQDRIFDPFFTTKAPGEGTGLGLSVVKTVVEEHRGILNLVSSDKGSTFEVYLPKFVASKAGTKDDNQDAGSDIYFGSAKIIVVDNERALSAVVCEMLRGLGYDVEQFQNPEDALSYYDEHKADVDLVITDQSMGKMNGTELLVEIRLINDDQKVVLCSGSSDHINEEEARQAGFRDFVRKPATLEQLSRVVYQVLKD